MSDQRFVLLRVPVNDLGLILSEEMERAAIDAAQEAHMADMSDQQELLEGVLAALRACPRVSEAAPEAEAVARSVFREGFIMGWLHRNLVQGNPPLGTTHACQAADDYLTEHPDIAVRFAAAARSPAAPPEGQP